MTTARLTSPDLELRSAAGPGGSVVFEQGIPFPLLNSVAYRRLFAIELWLRRIASAALFAISGANMLAAFPDALAREVKQRRQGLQARAHLGAEMSGDAVWMTTIEELRDLLIAESLFPTVRKLTGFHRPMLTSKLDEIREIRNIVGHYRAISRKTEVILAGDIASLESGIERFRREIVPVVKPSGRLAGAIGKQLEEHFESRAVEAELPVPYTALQLSESEFFYSLSTIPRYLRDQVSEQERDLGAWIDIPLALEQFHGVYHNLLCIALTARAGGISVVWTKRALEEENATIVDSFLQGMSTLWCEEEYQFQAGSAVCDPRVWCEG